MKNRTTPVSSLAAFLTLSLFVLGCNWSFNTGNTNNTNSNTTNSNAAAKGGNSNGGARNTSGADNSRANGNSAEGGSRGGNQAGGESGSGGGEANTGEGGGSASRGGGARGGSGSGGTISITIINDANYDIFRVFMSPTREQNWGPDQLGSQIIRKNGGRYTLRDVPCDSYDVRLVDEDNDECIMRNVSFCGADREWRISNEELLRCQAQSR